MAPPLSLEVSLSGRKHETCSFAYAMESRRVCITLYELVLTGYDGGGHHRSGTERDNRSDVITTTTTCRPCDADCTINLKLQILFNL